MIASDYAGHLEDVARALSAHRARHRIRRAVLVWGLVGVSLAAAIAVLSTNSPAAADPNTETVLPADGVTSIERVGDEWTVTTIAAPSEIKAMTPDIGPICGTNYADTLGLCWTTTTFTAVTACVYVQVDGIPGEDSSDPYVCRTTPTSTPTPEATPWPTTTPEPESTSTPQPTSPATSVPTSSATPEDATPSPSSTVNALGETSPDEAGQRTLANTGNTPAAPAFAAFILLALGIAAGSKAGARLLRLSDDSE